MLLLTLAVGGSYFLPTDTIQSRALWYGVCIGAEAFVMLVAFLFETKASMVIIAICAMLEINHFTGLFFGGHKPGSPYEWVVKSLEYIELSSLVLFSRSILNSLKEHIKCRIQKHSYGCLQVH